MKLNNVTIIGNLTKDVEVRTGETNSLVLMDVAVNKVVKGENQADFFRVEYWTSNQSLIEKLKKGVCVYARGRLQQHTYTRKDGTAGRDYYIMARRVTTANEGHMPSAAYATVNAFAAMPPVQRGAAVAMRIVVDGAYDKEKKSAEGVFCDAVAFREMGDWVLKNRHKGDSMNLCGQLSFNEYTTKDGQKRKEPQILLDDYPDVVRYAKDTNTGSAAPEASDTAPASDADVYADISNDEIPF